MNKPKRNRRNYIVKPKVSKKLVISAAASVMAVTIASSLVWNAMRESVPVEANTLSGVEAALKDHGSGDSYVILDIVPGTGETIDDLPLGTFGNLTIGQSPKELKLAKMFADDYDKYKIYDNRYNEADYYEESLIGGSGWIKINDGEPFERTEKFSEANAKDLYRSVVYGTAVQMSGGPYMLLSELVAKEQSMVAAEGTTFSYANEPRKEGYLPSEDTVSIGNIDDTYSEDNDTHIYRLEDGVYKYCGTIGDIVAGRKAWQEYEEEYEKYKEDYIRYEEEYKEYEEELKKFEEAYAEYLEQQKNAGITGTTDGDGEGVTEPSEGEGEETKEPSEGEGEETKEPSEGEDEETKEPSEGDDEGTKEPSEGDDEGTNKPSEGDGDGELPSETQSSSEGDEPDSIASLSWMKFVGDDTVAEITNEPTAEDEASPASGEILLEEPKRPDEPKVPIEPEKPGVEKEDEESNYEYFIVEFEYVRADSDEELIEGLYIPDEYDMVTVESSVMLALNDGVEVEADSRSIENTIEEEDTLVYVGENGTYRIVMGGNEAKNLRVYSAPTYFRCSTIDLFKEYVLENSGINIKVVVKSASAVSLDDVNNADMIYLEDAVIGDGKGEYIHEGSNDMLDSVVYRIIDRAVNDMTPVIVDKEVAESDNSKYNGTNYQKLANIITITDLTSFFLDFEDDVTGMLMNANTDEYGRRSDIDGKWVNNNILRVEAGWFIYDKDDFTDDFTDTDMEGFEAVKSAIDMENRQGNNIELGACKATAIQYIINYANGFIGEFRDFAILELQPTSTNGEHDLQTRDDKRNNTILYWKSPGSSSSGQQLLRSRKSIDITIDTESVAQFVGEQSDINNRYQMIFIGLDGKNLYYNSGETVYNNSDMNGLVYSAVGDSANGSENYEGIDITTQKKDALLNFMRAGYPVVVENNFFKDKTAKGANASDINTDYIAPSSNMYRFLQEALSEEWGRYCLYTIADVHLNSSDFAAQINAHRPRIEFDADNELSKINPAYAQQVQTVSADAVDGKYRGYIAYKVTNDIGEYYDQSWNLRFYLDMNQDGRFDDSEDVTNDVVIGNGMLMVEFAAPERGSIPWKLEVSDEANRYRRDDLTGYFNIYHSTQLPIRIVQVIGAEDMDASYNLQAAYEIIPDQALIGYYLKNAETLTNTEFDISTMTVGQLAAELKDNVEYLSGVDVLVLGFGPDVYSMSVPVEGTGLNVDWFVNKYILEGRGVLVSSAASSAASGRMQLDAGVLGQRDVKTYNSLGMNKPSDFNYKYSNLEFGMFDEWGFLSASRINDGAISHYPYEIGPGVQLGGGNLKIADYVLDLENNGQSGTTADVTAWYTLGNSTLIGAETSYGASINDAANNYYIYSKGNVVYVGSNTYPYVYDGAGGAAPADDTAGTYDCKLFVNALMEAYSVGIKNPKVSIVAGLSDDSSETDSICIPYDEQIREIEADTDGALSSKGVLDDTVDVYFKVSEPNFAFKKDVTIAFYYEDNISGVPVDVGGRVVNATQFTSEIWTVEQNQLVPVNVGSGLDLVPGKIYKIKAPVVSLRNDDNSVNADIYIVVQSHFIKLGQDRHPIGSDSVTLNRAQLFLLE